MAARKEIRLYRQPAGGWGALKATARRCTPEFFAAHTVSELESWSDYDLEMQGRLTHPMVYDAASDRFRQTWSESRRAWYSPRPGASISPT